MLTENTVVDACCLHLESRGFSILAKAKGSEQGIDIVAQGHGFRIFVEAKGETSGKVTSERYGKPFDSKQVFDVVAKAIYKSLANRHNKLYQEGDILAIALPDTPLFRKYHERVSEVLGRIQLVTMWVFESEKGERVAIDVDQYSHASVCFPSDGASLIETSPHPYAVNDAPKRERQGFTFYPDKNWHKDCAPFYGRSILIGWGENRQYRISLDTDILSGVLNGILQFERIRLLK